MSARDSLMITLVGVCVGALLAWIIGKLQQIRLLQKLQDMWMDRERVSLNEELLMTQLLAEKIRKAKFTPDVIFAVSPGGMRIAEWLSRRFLGSFSNPIPVQTICIVAERKSEGVVSYKAVVDRKNTAAPSDSFKDFKVLLVNDISRSGHTLEAAYDFLKDYLPAENIRSAVLICNEFASVKPTFYKTLTSKTVRFDWKHDKS